MVAQGQGRPLAACSLPAILEASLEQSIMPSPSSAEWSKLLSYSASNRPSFPVRAHAYLDQHGLPSDDDARKLMVAALSNRAPAIVARLLAQGMDPQHRRSPQDWPAGVAWVWGAMQQWEQSRTRDLADRERWAEGMAQVFDAGLDAKTMNDFLARHGLDDLVSWAVKQSHAPALRELLRLGADPWCCDKEGKHWNQFVSQSLSMALNAMGELDVPTPHVTRALALGQVWVEAGMDLNAQAPDGSGLLFGPHRDLPQFQGWLTQRALNEQLPAAPSSPKPSRRL